MENDVNVRQTMLDSIKHFASLYANGVMRSDGVDIDALCDLAIRRATSRLNGTDRLEDLESFVDDLIRKALARALDENNRLKYKLSDMINKQVDLVLSDTANIDAAIRKKLDAVLVQSEKDERVMKEVQTAKAIDIRCYRMHENGHPCSKIAKRLGVDVARVEQGIQKSKRIIGRLDDALDMYRG